MDIDERLCLLLQNSESLHASCQKLNVAASIWLRQQIQCCSDCLDPLGDRIDQLVAAISRLENPGCP
jgi:hypothetical protein